MTRCKDQVQVVYDKKVYIIFVSFYPEYFYPVVKVLECLTANSTRTYKIITVNNNPKTFIPNEFTYDILIGSNPNWEFSGWDGGCKFVKKEYHLKAQDQIILANDTFCYQKYRIISNCSAFLTQIQKSLNSLKSYVFGHLNGESNKPYCIKNQKFKHWISTYLLCGNHNYFERVSTFQLFDVLCERDELILSKDKINFKAADINFKKHLNSWLFPEGRGDITRLEVKK